MAANDIKILKSRFTVERFKTEANVKLGIQPGDAVIVAGTGTNYVDVLLDGMPTRGTDVFAGITRSAATNTASVDGVVDVELVGPGVVLVGKATTAANVDTAAELNGILNDVTNFDRSAATAAGILTIDETNTTAKKSSTLSLVILNGDIQKGTLRVLCTAGLTTGSNI